MEHQWQLLSKVQGAYSVGRRSWCNRCGALKDSSVSEDAYGLENGEDSLRYCAPGGTWTEKEPPCKGE